MAVFERVVPHQLHGLIVVLVRLARKSADDIRRELQAGNELEQSVTALPELLHGVLPVHGEQDRVARRLHRDVQVGEDERVVQAFGNLLEGVEHERGVGHPDPEPRFAALGKHFDDPPEQLWKPHSQVPAIRPRVLAAEPDLPDLRVLRGRPGARDDLVRVVRTKLAPRVLGLAVRAAAEAARGKRDYLHVAILPDLGEVEPRQGLLRQELDLVSAEGLLHGLHHPVDL
mmetsp:Transcript_665/g.2636  ORF Transcript_665/g.2636 Transcript_665/m.2636 type:complete len:229 (+) Transcript_665:2580-3266(+)